PKPLGLDDVEVIEDEPPPRAKPAPAKPAKVVEAIADDEDDATPMKVKPAEKKPVPKLVGLKSDTRDDEDDDDRPRKKKKKKDDGPSVGMRLLSGAATLAAKS